MSEKTKIDRSGIMKQAHVFYKQGVGSFSVCLKKSWKLYRVKSQMLNGITMFSFYKKDGSIREAVGTLIDIEYKTKGSVKKSNNDLQTFFDVEKQQFRSFIKANIIL